MKNVDTCAFIEEVKKRPCLWNSKCKKRSTFNNVQKCWIEVKNAFPEARNSHISDFKKKWKNLRDVYLKRLKLALAEPDQESEWPWSKEMEFMRKELTPKVIMKLQCTDNETFFNVKDESEEQNDEEEEDVLAEEPPPKMRRNEDEIYFEAPTFQTSSPIVQETESPKPQSQDHHFLMSILPEMEKLPIVNRLRLRNKINMALIEEINAANGQSAF